ncbi:methyltransferase [Pseudomonas aeruginosa]|nr:methyltransferase [Pseudomonas aeruginosa]
MIAADGIDGAPRELAAIVSNPPFHQGVHTDYQASERLLPPAPPSTWRRAANCAWSPAALKYPPLIERHLGPCRTLAEGDGFHIYSARRS